MQDRKGLFHYVTLMETFRPLANAASASYEVDGSENVHEIASGLLCASSETFLKRRKCHVIHMESP